MWILDKPVTRLEHGEVPTFVQVTVYPLPPPSIYATTFVKLFVPHGLRRRGLGLV